MGFVQEKQYQQRHVNIVEYETSPEFSSTNDVMPTSTSTSLETLNSGQHILHEAYQVLQQRQCLPPKGGYPFSKNDHVTTKMGKMPPSPYKCCGSANHWDKECPNWNTYLERARCLANAVETQPEDESEKAYVSAYSVLLNERLSEDLINLPELHESVTQQGFEQALSSSQHHAEEVSKSSVVEAYNASRRMTIENVEDEDWIAHQAKPKCAKHPLERIDESGFPDSEDLKGIEPNFRSLPCQSDESNPPAAARQQANTATKETPSLDETTGPPTKDLKIKLNKRRFTPSGSSAVGVSVVAVQGWVGSMRNDPTDLRLDSCTDVTLISQEYLESLKDHPLCQKGLKMDLWQLTDKDAKIQGFV